MKRGAAAQRCDFQVQERAGRADWAAVYSAPAGRAALNDLRGWPLPCLARPPRVEHALTSSNVAQSYPYTTETEAERAAAIARAAEKFDGLADKIAAESEPMVYDDPQEPGRPHRTWVFVCPQHVSGRLHVAGFARERRALFTVCDEGGDTYLR